MKNRTFRNSICITVSVRSVSVYDDNGFFFHLYFIFYKMFDYTDCSESIPIYDQHIFHQFHFVMIIIIINLCASTPFGCGYLVMLADSRYMYNCEIFCGKQPLNCCQLEPIYATLWNFTQQYLFNNSIDRYVVAEPFIHSYVGTELLVSSFFRLCSVVSLILKISTHAEVMWNIYELKHKWKIKRTKHSVHAVPSSNNQLLQCVPLTQSVYRFICYLTITVF